MSLGMRADWAIACELEELAKPRSCSLQRSGRHRTLVRVRGFGRVKSAADSEYVDDCIIAVPESVARQGNARTTAVVEVEVFGRRRFMGTSLLRQD
jgi:hypothetical protein